MTDEDRKRVEEIEKRVEWYKVLRPEEKLLADRGLAGRIAENDRAWLLSTIKSLQKDNRELKEHPNIVSICNACDLNRKALADSQEQFFQATRELAAANERGERMREALKKAVAAEYIRRDLGKKIYNQEIKASWLPEAEQTLTDLKEEPPFDVAEDQTTEMAVRIAALESDLAMERGEKERLRCEHDFGLQVDQECLDTLKELATKGQAEKVQLYCNNCRATPYLEVKWSPVRGDKEADLAKEREEKEELQEDRDGLADDFNFQHEKAKRLEAQLLAARDKEVEEAQGLPSWILNKLKTMKFYEFPANNRDMISEIYGWMHVLCASYDSFKRLLPNVDKQSQKLIEAKAQLAALEREKGELRKELYSFQKEAIDVAARSMELDAQLHAANERGERMREALRQLLSIANAHSAHDNCHAKLGACADIARSALAGEASR